MKQNIIILGMTMRKYIYALLALMMAMTVSAQKLTPQEEREFYQKAYDVINIYAQSAKLSDDRDVSRFSDLFESNKINIFNDLMSLSYEPELPVSKYIRLLREADMQTVTVKDVQKIGQVEDKGSVWQLSLSFNKNISFVSKCNTLFDSHEFFGQDYRLLMTISMDKSTGSCYISGIQADGPFELFPKDYRVLVKTDERDNNLDIMGTYVKFVMDQKLLRPQEKLSYRGAKVKEKNMEGQCDHKVYADYNDKAWRVRIGGAYALSGFNKLSDTDDITTSKDNEMGFGLDIGYVFPSTSHLRVGVFAGVGLSMNNLTMKLTPKGKDLEYNAPGSADEDGDPYTRMYEMIDNKGITQEIEATDIAIPLYADIEYEFNSIISIYADLGVKFQTSTGKLSANIGNYRTWGVYSGYGEPLTIGKDDNVILNDFGNKESIGIDEEGFTKSMAIDGLVGLGLRFNINKSFAFDAGVQYQIGSNSWKGEKGNIFSYSLKDGDKVNLLRKTNGISHNALKIAASLIFKF